MSSSKAIRFVFDVQCPYSYLASKRLTKLSQACGADLEYFPVLLGGLYDGTKAPQGKDGSASDVMALVKQKYNAYDLKRECERWGVKLSWNSKHPVRSVLAQRLLAGIADQKVRASVSHAFLDLYWEQNGDISDVKEIRKIAQSFNISQSAVEKALSDKETLRENTDWAIKRGVFGVPSFFVSENDVMDDRFWHGSDRMFLVGHRLTASKVEPMSSPLRLYPTKTSSYRPKLDWYHDFSSPWSYISSMQIERVASEHGAELVPKPILLGALFKSIGTPNVPMFAMSEAKRTYMTLDMQDWLKWWGGISFTFPQGFPIRTVVPLRVSIAEPKTTFVIYKAAWQKGLNVGDDSTLIQVLNENGFDGESLVRRAKQEGALKDILTSNTKEAEQRSCCGVPSFAVEGGPTIWGQDRFNVVEDELELAKQKKQASARSNL